MILGMNSLATSDSSSTEAVTPVSPRPMGRPSGYSEETVGRLCEMIRRRGLSDGKAGLSLGISRPTLSRWKQEHAELADWLEMAREQYRDAKLALVDEAKTADGRADWRAAAWALEKAFPEDYGRRAAAAARPPAAEGFSPILQAPPEFTVLPEMQEIVRRINEEEALYEAEAGRHA
jgi:hypothetical protein